MLLVIYTPCIWALPPGWVYLSDIAPQIEQSIRYAGNNNFIGRKIKGYQKPRCVLTKNAALALLKVQIRLEKRGLGLKVYDCYRPQVAVNDFYDWHMNNDTKQKQAFYPREEKRNLFKRGYIAKYSGHSRGSTVDLTIVPKTLRQLTNRKVYQTTLACYKANRITDNSLDMGTNFDCLDVKAHYKTQGLSPRVKNNRALLRKVMLEAGFSPYPKEWWHFTLKNEPYPKQYFNFLVK